MNIEKAVSILQYHQKWRRGLVDEYKYTSKEVGLAIDEVLNLIKSKTTQKNMGKENKLCAGLNDAAKQIHEANKDKGFWDKKRETGTLLMLCVSELAEALEADRKGRFADIEMYDKMVENLQDYTRKDFKLEKEIFYFKENIKDTFEDELADTVIRILDICGARGIDIERHIKLKLNYNARRERMHGKKY